jgi:hypothetical protein
MELRKNLQNKCDCQFWCQSNVTISRINTPTEHDETGNDEKVQIKANEFFETQM